MTDGPSGDLAGSPVLDADGVAIGTVRQLYISDATGQPGWVVIGMDAGEGGDRFAPLAGSQIRGSYLVLGVPGRLVSEAPWPGLDGAGRLPAAGAEMLARHYGWTGTQDDPGGGHGEAGGMTVSEERLQVGTQRVVTGRARLIRYVVTEEVTLTVQVSHEEVRVELEPPPAPGDEPAASIDPEPADPAADTRDRAEPWMILHAERPVVQLESVPVERVRLRVETVTGQQEITGQVRKERIDTPEVEATPPAP